MAFETLWLKRTLIPFWVIQILVCLLYLGISIASLALWSSVDDNDYVESGNSEYAVDTTAISRAINIAAGVLVGITALTMLFDIVEMVLFCTKRLNPVIVVVFNTISTIMWTVLLILLVISAVRVRSSGISLIFIIIVLATSLGKLIYGSVMLHRHRRGRFAYRGEYTPAAHEAGLGDISYHGSSHGPYPAMTQSRTGPAREYYSPASVGARE